MTTVLVLVILGVIWAAVLLPPYLQNRREHRPGDSIASFRHQLAVIERATPEGRARSVTRFDARTDSSPRYAPTSTPYAPATQVRRPVGPQARRMDPAKKRRKDVLVTLLGACAVTFLGAVTLGGPVLLLHVVLDVALVGYVAMLVKVQQVNAEREMKVRFIEPQARTVGHLRSVPSMDQQYQQPALRRVGT